MQSVANANGPVLVHVDAKATLKLVDRESLQIDQILDNLLSKLNELVDHSEIWVCTFLYDYLSAGKVDLDNGLSQVGLLSEFARNRYIHVRPDPVFRVNIRCAENEANTARVEDHKKICNDLFGEGSLFAELLEYNGSIFWFGAPLSVMTILHYLEKCLQVPYRYRKNFTGVIKWKGRSFQHESSYYVRPNQISIDYDYSVRDLAVIDGVIKEVPNGGGVCYWANARDLFSYFSEKVKSDSLYLLEENSRIIINEKLDFLGRKFTISDFENI